MAVTDPPPIEIAVYLTYVLFVKPYRPTCTIHIGQRLELTDKGRIRCLSSPDDDIHAPVQDDIRLSIKLIQQPDSISSVAYITFPIAAGRRRVRVPPGHKLFLNYNGTIVVRQLKLEEIAPLAAIPSEVHNANFDWRGKTQVEGSIVRQSYLEYEFGGTETIRWPILDQPTILDRESLIDVLTLPAICNFLRADALSDEQNPLLVHVDKRFRVSRARKRFQPSNIVNLMNLAGIEEARRPDVVYGARLVMEALEVIVEEAYHDTVADLYKTGMLGT